MRISINALEREQALLALDLGDKQCDIARKQLERLHVEVFEVMRLQGQFGEIRKALNNKSRFVYDWGFDERRAVAIALRIYRDSLHKLEAKEIALLRKENDATQEEIGDVTDFLARLAGQDTFWSEPAPDQVEDRPAARAADAKQEELLVGDELPGVIAEQLELAAEAPRGDVVLRLERLAGLLERGPETRFNDAAFQVLAGFALRLCSRVVPDFDATRAGGWLLQEVIYDDVNAMMLASWIRSQLELVGAPKLSREAVNDIRQSLGKDPLEPSPEEQRVLDEHTPRNPLEVACRHCGVAPRKPCRSVGHKVIGSAAHAERMKDVGMWGDARLVELANALYMDAVAHQVFGRVDDEIRAAVRKRRTIDGDAKWVATLLASAPAGGAHASA